MWEATGSEKLFKVFFTPRLSRDFNLRQRELKSDTVTVLHYVIAMVGQRQMCAATLRLKTHIVYENFYYNINHVMGL